MDLTTHDTEPPRPEGAATPTEREQLEVISLARIDPSPTNPRKRFDAVKLAELAASIAAKGLIAPVVLRPLPTGRFELVVGERRYRASKLAERATILAVVRTLTDREVCEIQLEENGQREDVHPLEEADAYRHLQEQGAALEELAARTGKSVAYVRQRLQYCALGTEAREAFLDGVLTAATALLVARIPVPKLQADAVREITRRDQHGDVMTPGEAGHHVRSRYMLRLAAAPFDRTAATLLEGVPACAACPKRTGAQPELFGDVDSPDVCTDPNCFSAKKDADWRQRTAVAKREGKAVLPEKEARQVFGYGGRLTYNSEYVDLAEKPYDYGNDGKKTLKGLLGKGNLPPVTIARDSEGGVHELVKKPDLAKALKAAGIEKKPTPTAANDDQRKLKEKLALRRATLARALAALVAAVEAAKPDLAFWRFLLALFISNDAGHDETKVVAKRRALEVTKHDEEGAVRAAAEGMKEAQLRGLLLELLCASPPFAYASDYGRSLRGACEHFGIDLKALEGEARTELAAAKKARGTKVAKSSAVAPKRTKGKANAPARATPSSSTSTAPKARTAPAPTKGKALPEASSSGPERAPIDTRVPTVAVVDWNRLSDAEQHRLTWVTYDGQIGTGYNPWKVGAEAVTGGSLNMGTPHQQAIAAIAAELGLAVTWAPWVPESRKPKASGKVAASARAKAPAKGPSKPATKKGAR